MVKIKLSRYRPGRPLEFQEAEASEFLDNRHMKVVRLSALRTGRLYSQEGFLVLISVRGRVDPRVTTRPEGLSHCKIPVTPSGIETATFQLVAQCLNQTLTQHIYHIFSVSGVLCSPLHHWKISLHDLRVYGTLDPSSE
jgi:hypothetical protein